MPLLTVKDVSLSFGGPPLLDKVNLKIVPGEKICLIGRNGSGKSTLLKLMHGDLSPDSGTLTRAPGLKTALLPQEVPSDLEGSVYDVVASGQPQHAAWLREYQRLCLQLEERSEPACLERLERTQQALEVSGAWDLHQQVLTVIARLGLKGHAACRALSAGLKRRVYLARALLSEPDLLLLDEPTNHLDIETIIWMEQFLERSAKTMVFITHDRAFLSRLASSIVELDRARLLVFGGDYDHYLQRKDELLENEQRQQAAFDKQLQREEAWVRQGIKARRTRNEGRVRALKEMRAVIQHRHAGNGTVRALLQEAERSGKLVIDAHDIAFAYGEHLVLEAFSTTILRGEKVGIIGPNGCGKTTLLRLLLGELTPHKGQVRHGARLQVAYFDQLRAQLDENKTLQQNVAEDGDTVFVGGKPRHVIGYLQDFLFSPTQARSPITTLSGGERNRLLLAKLFTRPSNVLVLDEPTNDLDAETLELLEAMLIEYAGTVLMVSHDRAFLNHVASSTLVFEGHTRVHEYVGGYDDWLRQRPREEAPPLRKTRPRREPAGPRRLSFKEQHELEGLPEIIDKLEGNRRALYESLSDPELYRSAGTDIAALQARLDELEHELAAAYARWEELEDLALTTA